MRKLHDYYLRYFYCFIWPMHKTQPSHKIHQIYLNPLNRMKIPNKIESMALTRAKEKILKTEKDHPKITSTVTMR